ncbi:MAG TPA: thiamine phosphate synthase [Pseudogracilibacillus sp.]|nr:thiamine phosphate synthase [Pseudogracilibacillus sp.]
MKELHIISTGKQSLDEFVGKVKLIHKQIDYVHIREKMWTDDLYMTCINNLLTEGLPKQKIILNNRPILAQKMGLDHIHLPAAKLYEAMERYEQSVSYSVHNIAEARQAERRGASFVLAGHIYATDSKKDIQPRGLELLKVLRSQLTIPVIAIGGIRQEYVAQVLQAGASGIALLSHILLAEDCERESLAYRERLDKGG